MKARLLEQMKLDAVEIAGQERLFVGN